VSTGKNKHIDWLFWLALAQCLAWVMGVLTIPSLITIFTGVPQYWLDWPSVRQNTLFIFGFGLIVELVIVGVIKADM